MTAAQAVAFPRRPVVPFRRLCFRCGKPDQSRKVVDRGRAVTVCMCGAVDDRTAEPGERSDA